MRKTISLLMSVLLLSGCSSRPDDVLPENKMANVLADLSIADQLSMRNGREGGVFASDSARKVLRQSIMKTHGVTEAQFDSTLNWYGHHMADYSELYKKVDQQLAQRQKKISKNAGTADSGKDNLWPMPAMISISEHDATGGFSFTMPGTRLQPGQDLQWSFRTTRLKGSATAFLAAEYPGNEMKYTRRNIHGDRSVELSLKLEPRRRPLRIFGYVHVSKIDQRIWLDSLRLIQQKPTAAIMPDASPQFSIITQR